MQCEIDFSYALHVFKIVLHVIATLSSATGARHQMWWRMSLSCTDVVVLQKASQNHHDNVRFLLEHFLDGKYFPEFGLGEMDYQFGNLQTRSTRPKDD